MLTAENGSIQLSMLTFFIHSEFFIVDCLSKVPYKVVVVSRFCYPQVILSGRRSPSTSDVTLYSWFILETSGTISLPINDIRKPRFTHAWLVFLLRQSDIGHLISVLGRLYTILQLPSLQSLYYHKKEFIDHFMFWWA